MRADNLEQRLDVSHMRNTLGSDTNIIMPDLDVKGHGLHNEHHQDIIACLCEENNRVSDIVCTDLKLPQPRNNKLNIQLDSDSRTAY